MVKSRHITLRYHKQRSTIALTYAISLLTLHKINLFRSGPEPPTDAELSAWLERHDLGELDRDDGPALVEYHLDGSTREEYYSHGRLHRANGPAVIERREDYYIYGRHQRCIDALAKKPRQSSRKPLAPRLIPLS